MRSDELQVWRVRSGTRASTFWRRCAVTATCSRYSTTSTTPNTSSSAYLIGNAFECATQVLLEHFVYDPLIDWRVQWSGTGHESTLVPLSVLDPALAARCSRRKRALEHLATFQVHQPPFRFLPQRSGRSGRFFFGPT